MIRKTIAGLTAAAALAAPLALAAPASATETGPTLFEAVASSLGNNNGAATDRNWYDFDILANGVLAADAGAKPDDPRLQDALSDPNADLTVFIPNDRAFQALVADLKGPKFWFANEATILGEVAKLGADTLRTVILYHAVPGEIKSTKALTVPRGTPLDTVLGSTTTAEGDFQIRVTPLPRLGTAILADEDRDDVNPFLVRSQLDIEASNGIAHGISFVLRPIDL
jgi:uncharacterized surface protein with fasciclin (FAS1) repeats